MNVSYHNCRCKLCFKRFELPIPLNSNIGRCFINYDNYEFRYYEYDKDGVNEIHISKFLDSDIDYQVANDNSRGIVALELLCLLSDGNYSPIKGDIKCPRCNFSFHTVSNNVVRKDKIKELSFNKTKKKNTAEISKILAVGWNSPWFDFYGGG